MLFNSYVFLFVFLPLALLGFYLIGALAPRPRAASVAWLLLASYAFYAYWHPPFLLLLAGLTLANYGLSRWMRRSGETTRNRLCAFGIAANLAVLGYYKYALFLIGILSPWTGAPETLPHIVLPIGLSFYTFQQIAYLCDTRKNPEAIRYSLVEYAFLISFFPQLIAGPIIHHNELLPQCRNRFTKWRIRQFAPGVALFLIGLCKKAVFADNIAPVAILFFDSAATGVVHGSLDAWIGTLAYTLQIYFDFSGYSDMACGLALLFNFRVPPNFNSPYQAASIVEFWRRWHITLSRFLRDYLYIPLGGSRGSVLRTTTILLTTMLLGGLWHGAGWTFVVWGGIHGVGLAANHGWLLCRGRRGLPQLPAIPSWILTFLWVAAAWVFFRAKDLPTAMAITHSLFNFSPSDGTIWLTVKSNKFAIMAVLGLIALFAPNSHQWLRHYRPVFGKTAATSPGTWRIRARYLLHPSGAFALGLFLVIILLNMPRVSEFIYFQF